MSRSTNDEFRNGLLWNGYDYTRQAWVKDGVYLRCGHPESMQCGCYGREHAGQTSEERQPGSVESLINSLAALAEAKASNAEFRTILHFEQVIKSEAATLWEHVIRHAVKQAGR
ncbi:MAG: hypothetical protein WBF09_20650 [Candidatus Acidiferrum sp.]